jgi:hypothetical protein
MRLLRYDAKKKRWIQLFADSALDKYKNLSDVVDKKAARDNLELDEYYWNKAALKDGAAVNSIHNVCVIQDEKAQFVTKADKENWNQKVDRPIVKSTADEELPEMTEGQMVYNRATDTIKVKIDGKIRDFENNREIHGTANFAGMGNEVKIEHHLETIHGVKITPKFVGISCVTNPGGMLGETWTRKDDTYFYVGNTGSYQGPFEYMVYY